MSDCKIEDVDEQAYLKMLGFNPSMFEHTIDAIDSVRHQGLQMASVHIGEMLSGDEEHNQSAHTLSQLVQPLIELDLKLDN